VPEIERMEKKGCVNVSSGNNPIFVLSSLFKDPRGGAIGEDSFLVNTHEIPEAYLDDHFKCLQDTGDYCQTDSGVPK